MRSRSFCTFPILLLVLQIFCSSPGGFCEAQNTTNLPEKENNSTTATPTAKDGLEIQPETSSPTSAPSVTGSDGAKSQNSEDETEERFQDLKQKTLQIVEHDGDELKWLPLPEGYNKQALPPPASKHYISGQNLPKVAVFINIRGINNIDMKTEKITLDLDLYEFWADPRFHPNHTLGVDQNSNKKSNNGPILIEIQKLHPDFVNNIWVPDLIIENCAIVPHNDLTSEPLVSFNTETGFVKYTRLEVTSPCPMSFFYYPLDTQNCEVTLRSYKHFNDQLELHWVHNGVFMGALENPNYAIKVDSVTKRERISKSIHLPNLFDKIQFGNIIWADRSFDLLSISLKFRRNVSFHISQTYLPSTLFIGITWLCFLLPPGMAASRVGITMTTLLTINTMFNSVREHSPQVTYAKAIDLWMEACIIFTFLALFEFCLMSWLEYVKEREESRKKEHEAELNKAAEKVTTAAGIAAEICENRKDDKSQPHQEFHAMLSHARHGHSSIKMMDPARLRRVLRIRKFLKKYGLTLLSATFILFNAIYWAWICGGSEYYVWELDKRFNG